MALLGPETGLEMMGAFFVVWLIVMLALYVYFALALMFIAKKTRTKNAWLAWIPIANIYLMTQVGKVPAWWTLAVLLPFIPFIGGLAMAAVIVYIWWKIAEAIHRPGWWGILLIVPIVNLIIVGIMAWGK